MTEKKKHPGGRPSKYDPKYCEGIVSFFSKNPYEEHSDHKRFPNPLPTIEMFAHKIGVSRSTVALWTEKHEEFSDAFKKARELQFNFWLTNSLLGLYPPGFACFTGKNMFGWRDKQEVEHTGGVIVEYAHRKNNEQG